MHDRFFDTILLQQNIIIINIYDKYNKHIKYNVWYILIIYNNYNYNNNNKQ